MEKISRQQRRDEEAEIAEYLERAADAVGHSDLLRRNRAAATAAGREHLFFEKLKESLAEVFADLPKVPRPTSAKSHTRIKRVLNVLLSDLHYGANLDPREVGGKYGPIEEARRTAAICREVADYKRQYRDETELIAHLLGDIIQGQLHDMRDGDPLAEQVAAAIYILVQAIRYLATQFRRVTVKCTPGNHGRNTARHRERATNQKWDAIETMIYYAIKVALADVPNVKVELTYEPKYDFDLLGEVGLGTHGDTVLNPGFPGKNIDVAGLVKQVNSINNARVAKGLKPYRVFVMGHVHTGAIIHLPGGIVIITNSCLIPPDAYANSIGIMDTANGQYMFESVEGHPVGDTRFITVDETTDEDETLDTIIQPYRGLSS